MLLGSKPSDGAQLADGAEARTRGNDSEYDAGWQRRCSAGTARGRALADEHGSEQRRNDGDRVMVDGVGGAALRMRSRDASSSMSQDIWRDPPYVHGAEHSRCSKWAIGSQRRDWGLPGRIRQGQGQNSKDGDELRAMVRRYASAFVRSGCNRQRGDFDDEGLTGARVSRYRKRMAQSFLVFDFGTNEELAQQARHKVDGWKQGFRLDKKLLLKFDRAETGQTAETPDTPETEDTEEEPTSKKSVKKSGKAAKNAKAAHAKDKEAQEKIQLIIRLDFSDHERLSHQRWLDRIPTEAPFKDAQAKIIRHNDAEFAGMAERFDSLP